MSDAIVTELRPPSPAKGEGTLRHKTKDATAALRTKKYRRKRKSTVTMSAPSRQKEEAEKRKDIKANITIYRPSSQAIDVTAYVAAIALAGAAAWFSIRGMVVLFPGSPLSVIGMSIAMEGAKLVTAAWLARRWRATAWVWRLGLVVLVTGLAVINATGVYAQLVAAHVGDRGAAQSAIETQDATLAARIEVAAHIVADLDRRLGQIDVAIEEAAKRGRTNAALSAMEGQRKARAALADQRQREGIALADLKAERAALRRTSWGAAFAWSRINSPKPASRRDRGPDKWSPERVARPNSSSDVAPCTLGIS